MLQVRQQPRAQQAVGQGRASALGVGLDNIARSNNCCVNVVIQVLKHCPALQKWLRSMALPDEFEVHPAHAYFVVCLFACSSDRACLCCEADL